MAQVREGHEPSVRDPVREQPSVARVDHGISGGPTGLADPLDGSRPVRIVSIC
jgi:hypothetical protein